MSSRLKLKEDSLESESQEISIISFSLSSIGLIVDWVDKNWSTGWNVEGPESGCTMGDSENE